MIYLLLWLLLGSLSLNIMWIKTNKLDRDTIHKLRNKKDNIKPIDYLKGLLFGLLMGPITCYFIFKGETK